MKNKHTLRKLGRNTDLRRHLFRCVRGPIRREQAIRKMANCASSGRSLTPLFPLFRFLLFSRSDVVTALVQHERIRTTVAKAKEIRRHAEQVVTWAKKGACGGVENPERAQARPPVVAPPSLTPLLFPLPRRRPPAPHPRQLLHPYPGARLQAVQGPRAALRVSGSSK